MGDYRLPPDLAREIADLRRRVETVERRAGRKPGTLVSRQNGNALGKPFLECGDDAEGYIRRGWSWDNTASSAAASPVVFYVSRDPVNWTNAGPIRVRVFTTYYTPGYYEAIVSYGHTQSAITVLHSVGTGACGIAGAGEGTIPGSGYSFQGFYVAIQAFCRVYVEVEYSTWWTETPPSGFRAELGPSQIQFVN